MDFAQGFSALLDLFLSASPEMIAIILGATVVSSLAQVIKKVLKISNEKVMMTTVVVIAGIASLLDYILTSANLPPTVLGVNTAVIVGVAQPIYFFVVKPLNVVLAQFMAFRKQIAAKVDAIEAINIVSELPQTNLTEVTVNEQEAPIENTIITPIVPEIKEEPKKVTVDF